MRPLLAAHLAAALLACARAPLPAPPVLAGEHVVDDAVRQRLDELVEEVRAHPGDAARLHVLAQTYHGNGLPDLAAETYAQVLALDPANARAWYQRAHALSELGDLSGACACMARAAELAPAEAPPRWRRGLWLLDLGRGAEALEELRAARAADPRDARALAGLARAELEHDRPDEAAALLREALALAPGDGAALHLLATALARLGDETGAARERARAALADEEPPDPWMEAVLTKKLGPRMDLELARARLEQLGPSAARREIEALLAVRPDDAGVLGLACELYFRLGEREAARSALEAARARCPDDPEIALVLAGVYSRSGELDRAIEETAAAVRLHPDLGPARHQLGSLQAQAGLSDAARLTFEEARKRGYQDPAMLLDLGVLQRVTGREMQAVETFEQTCALLPDSFQAHLFLARARGEIGDLAGAWVEHARAAELAPGHAGLSDVAARLRALEAEGGRR